MKLLYVLPFLAFWLPFTALAQGNCNNPITINSILISNTQCGTNTGTIIVTPSGPLGSLTFDWNPSVSNSNVATNLSADSYHIHIERTNDPSCILDTLVILTNSNGPQVQATINPAQCLANNGSISLSPTNLLYNWSTNGSLSSITGLASKNYYVTVTNPSTGCYSIFKYFVPRNLNSLTVSNLVQQNDKCNMSNGKAQVIVTGGSGQYSYNPGPGPQYNGLAAGNYLIQVQDNVTGCSGSTNFTIQQLPVSGSVTLTPHDVRCFGQATGFVEIEVTAGQNFKLPFVFTLKDANGAPHAPGNLPAGIFTLQVADQDGCTLPAQNFTIHQPPAFLAQTQATAETCIAGGQISLSISGGNGAPFIVNWADLPGDDNPKDRRNLHGGRYAAIVFDSLFCAYPIDTVLISPGCNKRIFSNMVLGVNTTEFFCVPAPIGLAPGATSFSLLGGGVNGSSSFGSWMINANGCMSYTAGAIPRFSVDTICIIRTAPLIGLKDTTCVIVSITQVPPSKQSVFFPVQVMESATACGTIPPAFSKVVIRQLGRPGLSGSSDVYGAYDVDPLNACLAFFAQDVPGSNVDEIRVAVFDTVLNKCHIISYFPSILPKNDCAAAVNFPDTLQIVITNCNAFGSTCLPIPYDDIVNYTIIDNASLYTAGFSGCDITPTLSYQVATLPPGGGPYELSEWIINGQNYTGNFLNVDGLANLMSLLDPSPLNWGAQGNGLIRGGDLTGNYGPLKIKSASGNTSLYNPSTQQVPQGTVLRFASGFHQVIFRNVQTACADTLAVKVVCFNCPPIHSYPLNTFGELRWKASSCAADTVFCTNIPNNELGQYLITDNGQQFLNFTLCGNFVGMVLDTGLHKLIIKNASSNCEWNVRFYLECNQILNQQDIPVNISLGETVTICLDTNFISSPITSIVNLCEEEGNNNVGYSLNNQTWCVQISGQQLGFDTLCIQLCNHAGECANYTLLIHVSNTPSDSLRAVTDVLFTLKNEAVEVNIIANDLIGGLIGNLAGLSKVEFLSDPTFGSITYNASNGMLSYTPNAGKCGVDSFSYRITDISGKQSSATIKVTISCDDILIFKGISPNDDGKNDTWTILGIEQYPNNNVQVFNRWGNKVFEQKGYNNANAWNGQWNSKDLPDGTYFYLIELGGTGGKLSGWLEILR